MITCDTMDTVRSVRETLDLVGVGCEIVRITAPTVRDAANLGEIVARLRASGCAVPVVADIHFKPEAAMEAAKWVEKIRINPGNFADSKKFAVREYTDEQYEAETGRIRERFAPLVSACKARGIAMRIGTNHGSLSDRIMNRYGDTPLGMVESALEFAAVARDEGYHDFVFSMKASNPKVMIHAYRLLVGRLAELGSDWNYPIHLGVTEAGDGEDGRIKSAIGIGALLADGLGDTIRVSLTEDSVHEIPAARELAWLAEEFRAESAAAADDLDPFDEFLPFDPFAFARRPSMAVAVGDTLVGRSEVVRVAGCRGTFRDFSGAAREPFRAEFDGADPAIVAVDPLDRSAVERLNADPDPRLVTVADGTPLPVITAFRLLAARIADRHPILLKDALSPAVAPPEPNRFDSRLIRASAVVGSLLCDGIGDAIWVRLGGVGESGLRLAYNILQAAGARIFKTDYVACPSCGRTLFDLQSTTARIKAATSHLKGVKIAIMGCIVNGPGEMADADFGYVGGAPGKINLYVGKRAVEFNIPEIEAVARLQELIREHGKWVEPSGP
jgi:(E)-4-hydroxy-3-methylbut-2-enyl-diphosphate synthase